jgi:hypothetical protein
MAKKEPEVTPLLEADGEIKLAANPFLQFGVPSFVASLGFLMCLILMLLPSDDKVLKLAGVMVLFTDLGTAVFLSRIFGSQSLRADAEGITQGSIFRDKFIPWSEIASYNRMAHRGDIQFRVYNADGEQTGRWSGYLGTQEGRERLIALLDEKTGQSPK